MTKIELNPQNLGHIISLTFDKDFWSEERRNQFLDDVRLLIAYLDGSCTTLYDEACEEAQKILEEQKNMNA